MIALVLTFLLAVTEPIAPSFADAPPAAADSIAQSQQTAQESIDATDGGFWALVVGGALALGKVGLSLAARIPSPLQGAAAVANAALPGLAGPKMQRQMKRAQQGVRDVVSVAAPMARELANMRPELVASASARLDNLAADLGLSEDERKLIADELLRAVEPKNLGHG